MKSLAKMLNNVSVLLVIMKLAIQKTLSEVVDYEREDDYNGSKGNVGKVEKVESASETANIRSYRELNFRRMSKEEKVGWLAGVIDGDGSISVIIRKNRTLQREVFVGSSDRDFVEIVDRVASKLGVDGKTYTLKTLLNGKKYEWYRWSVQNKENLGKLVYLLSKSICTTVKFTRLLKLSKSLGLDVELSYGKMTLPWIAGFFEADGVAYWWYKNGKKTFGVGFSQKDLRVLEDIKKRLSGIGIKSFYLNKSRAPRVYTLTIYTIDDVLTFINAIGKYVLSCGRLQQLLKLKVCLENRFVFTKCVKWTKEMCDVALSLRMKGYSYGQIARILNAKCNASLSYGAVESKIRRLRKKDGD